MAKQCELIIGYLLPRRCEEKSVSVCQQCQRAVCDLHVRVGDHGLLCRDCYEEGRPRQAEGPVSLPGPVRRVVYRRTAVPELDDRDFGLFDSEEATDTFSTLS